MQVSGNGSFPDPQPLNDAAQKQGSGFKVCMPHEAELPDQLPTHHWLDPSRMFIWDPERYIPLNPGS